MPLIELGHALLAATGSWKRGSSHWLAQLNRLSSLSKAWVRGVNKVRR